MALVKNSAAIPQLTATGTSTTAILTGIAPICMLHHSNGTGTITAAGTAEIQVQLNGAARWYSHPTLLVTFSTTSAATDDRQVILPDAATAARISYTVPTGATGPALDAEFGSVTP